MVRKLNVQGIIEIIYDYIEIFFNGVIKYAESLTIVIKIKNIISIVRIKKMFLMELDCQ